MQESTGYYVVKKRALPEVLLKVVEAKRLIDSEQLSIKEAVDKLGISRSSFYKYKEDIFPFHDTTTGTTITVMLQMDDVPGLLSDVLKIIATSKANILTIHQSIPVNGIATLSISVQILPSTSDISAMVHQMETQVGVRNVKIIAKE